VRCPSCGSLDTERQGTTGSLVSDAAPPFLAAHASYLAHVPLQLCRVHVSRGLDFDIAKA
jgi:hypothetical protein